MEASRKAPTTDSVPAYYNTIASDYDQLYTDPVSRYENAVVRSLLARLDLDGKDVLDLGCGTGLFLDLGFCPRRYLGLDVSPEMVRIARKKHPDRAFCVGDMAEPGLERYDAVLSLFGGASQVLHVPLADLLRPLRPGGIFVLMVFAEGQGERIGYRKDRACPGLPPLPVRFYSAQSLRQALLGMEQVKVIGLNACLPIHSTPSLAHFAVNALLERLAPSQAAFLIATGRRPGALCLADASLRMSSMPR